LEYEKDNIPASLAKLREALKTGDESAVRRILFEAVEASPEVLDSDHAKVRQ
jgi:hypothetical protein